MVRDRATKNLAKIFTGDGESVPPWFCKAFEETLTGHCSNLIKSVLKGKAGSCQPVSQDYCSFFFSSFFCVPQDRLHAAHSSVEGRGVVRVLTFSAAARHFSAKAK